MKIAIVSDLHANLEALASFPEECDELWILGDLVTYGPNPAEVVDAVRNRASLIVRGNHDHAAGTGANPRCSDAFHSMSEATLAFTNATLDAERKSWLAGLLLTAERTIDGTRFLLCHAVPSDPLFAYCRSDSRVGEASWQGYRQISFLSVILICHSCWKLTAVQWRTPAAWGNPRAVSRELVTRSGRTAQSSFGRMNTLSKRLSGRYWRCPFRTTSGVVSPMCFAQAAIQIAMLHTRRRDV